MWGKHGSFPHKTLWIAIVFPHMNFFFFMNFFKIIFVDFVEENIVAFLTKHYELLQYFPTLFFLLYFFQNYLCQFYFFNITITSKVK
jgi:hypothetical protein